MINKPPQPAGRPTGALGRGVRPGVRPDVRPDVRAARVSSAAPKKKSFDRGGPVWPPRSNVTNDRLRGGLGGLCPPSQKPGGLGGSAPQPKTKNFELINYLINYLFNTGGFINHSPRLIPAPHPCGTASPHPADVTDIFCEFLLEKLYDSFCQETFFDFFCFCVVRKIVHRK